MIGQERQLIAAASAIALTGVCVGVPADRARLAVLLRLVPLPDAHVSSAVAPVVASARALALAAARWDGAGVDPARHGLAVAVGQYWSRVAFDREGV